MGILSRSSVWLCVLGVAFAQSPEVASEKDFDPEPETGVPEYVDDADRDYYLSLTTEERVQAAMNVNLRGTIWGGDEQQRFGVHQEQHKLRFPDVRVPTSLAELTETQRAELDRLERGLEPMMSFAPDAERSALYASRFYRQSTWFKAETKTSRERKARQIESMSRRDASPMETVHIWLPIVAALGMFAFFMRRKK